MTTQKPTRVIDPDGRVLRVADLWRQALKEPHPRQRAILRRQALRIESGILPDGWRWCEDQLGGH